MTGWRICFAASAPLAHVVRGYLEGRGVPCLLRAQGPSVYPVPSLGVETEILVPEDWLPVARKMVERRRKPRPRVVALPLRRRAR